MTPGELLRAARAEAGMSQMELAFKMDTQQSSISRVESNRDHRTTVEFLARCIEATGVGTLELSIRREP